MKKQIFNWLLIAALALGMGLCTGSCKDDNNGQSEQCNDDADPLDTDEALVAWRWLCALTDAGSLTKDWAKKTYEPTVGVASEENRNTRIVVVADLDEAKAKFADLADIETARLDQEYTVSQSGVGKLTWTPSRQGSQNLAEVAVDTRLIPQLQKLVFCTSDQVGVNGIFSSNVSGTAYYRLGDVIRDERTGRYWVCVRPSFEQNDKGDSHWISVFNANVENAIPEENLKKAWNKVAKYNYNTIILPTGLKYKREHLNNFANLIFALLDPGAYAEKVGTSSSYTKNGLCGFDYKYHGKRFLTNVNRFWDMKDSNGRTLWEILFNCTYDKMKYDMHNMILIYQGYQWRIGNSGYIWEFKAPVDKGFQKSAPGSESGDKVSYEFGTEGFDVTRYTSNPWADNFVGGPKQFADTGDYRWVVEYKSGDQLVKSGSYSPYMPIEGYEDIYNYNALTSTLVRAPLETEETAGGGEQELTTPVPGCVIALDGKFYKTAKNPVALVVYVGERGSVEQNTNYRGLAISLRNAGGSKLATSAWMKNGAYGSCTEIVPPAEKATLDRHLNGIAMTAKLTGESHQHPAARQCKDFVPKMGGQFSDWFLPSAGQWILMAKGLFDVAWRNGTFEPVDADDALGRIFNKANITIDEFPNVDWMWSVTEASEKQVWKVSFSREGIEIDNWNDKSQYSPVLPMIAF